MTAHPDSAPREAGRATAAPAPPGGLALAIAAARSLATFLAISLYVLLVGPPAVLYARLAGRPGLLFTLSHGGVALGFALSGIAYRVVGRERLPSGRAAVYCANHASNIDAPLLFHVLHRRLHMLYKVEFGRMPILGGAAPLAGFIAVDRRNPDQSQAAVDQAALSVARGNSFLVFPEGTRSRTGELQPFKKGGFVMAIKAQAPVVPVAIVGAAAAMTKGSRLIRPVSVEVRIADPVETTGLTLDDRDALIARVRDRIGAMLEESS